MIRHLLILLLSAGSILSLQSQSNKTGTVSGKIFDSQTKMPVESATISLLRSADDKLVDGTVTDAKGKFRIDNIADGEYYISFSFIGYLKKSSPSFTIDLQHKAIDLGELTLEVSVKELNSVEVVGEKSTFVNSIDRKTFNVGKDVMTTSGSVSELMQHIPSLQVDIEGNVSLRGSENVLILINGRPSSLMGANRAAVLQQMPANTIGFTPRNPSMILVHGFSTWVMVSPTWTSLLFFIPEMMYPTSPAYTVSRTSCFNRNIPTSSA